MFQQFELHHLGSGASSERPNTRAKLTLDGIANRMFSKKSSESEEFRNLLQCMEESGSIMQRVLEHYSDKNWRPSIHAELALLEVMHERQCTFYDDDKFIACSKAACFCCYHYICSHPGAFARPACHNKVHRNWKPPKSAFAAEDPQNLRQRDIMNNLTAEVRKAVVARVLRQRSRRWPSLPISSEIAFNGRPRPLKSFVASEVAVEKASCSVEVKFWGNPSEPSLGTSDIAVGCFKLLESLLVASDISVREHPTSAEE